VVCMMCGLTGSAALYYTPYYRKTTQRYPHCASSNWERSPYCVVSGQWVVFVL
jgi:hypothetical protein